jgi:hypothetical protein
LSELPMPAVESKNDPTNSMFLCLTAAWRRLPSFVGEAVRAHIIRNIP